VMAIFTSGGSANGRSSSGMTDTPTAQ